MPRILNGIYSYRRARGKSEHEKGEAKKYRQIDLAEHVGIPRSRISMIENGWLLPTPAELEKIAEYLEVNPGQLYGKAVIAAIHEVWEEGENP